MVVKNDAVDVVYKAHYLKSAMIGSAAHFPNSTTLTDDNFDLVWEQLTKFYHNERVLLQSALHAAATMKKMNKESAFKLEQLYSTVNQIRNSLELLKRSMAGLDDQLVYATTQRFDPETQKAWELHLGPCQTPPVWTQLSSFIMARSASTSASSSGVKVHHSEAMTENKFHDRPPPSCTLCDELHFLSHCPVFINKTIEQRKDIVNQRRLCYNCLGKHRASACLSSLRCRRCGKRHHTSLHHSTARPATKDASAVHTNHGSAVQPSCIFLATAKLIIASDNGERIHVRALIDQGSEASLITERIVQRLRHTRGTNSTHIIGIGGQPTSRSRGIALFTAYSHLDNSRPMKTRAHILPKLTNALPTTCQPMRTWPHLQWLELADPEFFITSPDLILGADVYRQIIEEGIVKDGPLSPTAQLTRFGWIVSGPSGSSNEVAMLRTLHLKIDLDLDASLQRFWSLDEVRPKTSNSKHTEAEEECESHFLNTHSRDKDGRYIVRLPFKSPLSQLGDSKPKALRMLYCLQKKFRLNPAFKQSYTDFLGEYENLQHLVPVSSSLPEPDVVYSLSHHGVLKESSLTTKLRVVFNGSSATSNGTSLNDLLHSGVKLQIDLFDVLLFFRLNRYVFSGDIEKFYRQIKVHSDDWKFQRILWHVGNQLITYELTTNTYALACAAFLALRAFQQLLSDDGSKYPLALPMLTRGRYVDDIVGGADTVDEAKVQMAQIFNLCKAVGFPIQKWNSNHPDLLSDVPPEKRLEALSKPMHENSTVHALGLAWQPRADTFHFTIKMAVDAPVTKQKVLSANAQIFDPLGFLTPVVITGKIFIQELWTLKLGRNEELSQDASQTWTNYLNQLQDLQQLSIPRWLQLSAISTFEIHASQKAIAAVVYVRALVRGTPTITLMCSKTKVAPLKRLTIPRLEHCAAVLLSRQLKHVITSMNWSAHPTYCWTDSAITHTWVNNHLSRWKEFVHNRVNFLRGASPAVQWHFVPGKLNPADCATRGLTAAELISHPLSRNGHSYLLQTPDCWPSNIQTDFSHEMLEERPTKVNVVTAIPEPLLNYLFNRGNFFSLTRLVRSTVIFDRAVSRFKRQPSASLMTNPISPGDLEDARLYWIKHVQGQVFGKEIQILKRGEQLGKTHPLTRLTP